MRRHPLQAPRTVASLVAVGALLIGLLTAAPVAATASSIGCKSSQVLPENQLTPGTTGTALSVIKGSTVVSFKVTVLGILPNGIAPGVDFILIQVSGPVIDQIGGIAFGMSGSPVYVNGKLAGAISFGFFLADPTIGGMTPAQPMVDILKEPSATPIKLAKTVHIGTPLERAVARATGQSLDTVSGTATQLATPVSVSGLTPSRLGLVQKQLDKSGFNTVVTQGGSAPTPSATSGALEAGGSIGAAFSTGDITMAGIGTTTLVCGSKAVAFGHPFTFSGRTAFAMTQADIVATVTDPSKIAGPFKLGNVTNVVGTVNQDRLAGIGGVEGQLPATTAVTSDFANPDLGTQRSGETDIFFRDYVPYIAFYHMVANLDAVLNSGGAGSARFNFTIDGTREDGTPFSVEVDNLYQSPYVAYYASYQLEIALYLLQFNRFGETITINSVSGTGYITEQDLHANIVDVKTSTHRQPAFRSRSVVKVHRGGLIRMQVTLQPFGGGADQVVPMRVRVSKRASGQGTLSIKGTGIKGESFLSFRGASSFQELIAQIKSYSNRFNNIDATLSGKDMRPVHARVSPEFIVLGKRGIQVRVVR